MTSATGAPTAAKRRALIIDDQQALGKVMSLILQGGGYEADWAPGAEEAGQLLRQKDYDVIVCDIRLPGINGATLYESWREEWPELGERTLFITGENLGKEPADFLDRSQRPCIFKPFKARELLAAADEIAHGVKT